MRCLFRFGRLRWLYGEDGECEQVIRAVRGPEAGTIGVNGICLADGMWPLPALITREVG